MEIQLSTPPSQKDTALPNDKGVDDDRSKHSSTPQDNKPREKKPLDGKQ